MKESILHGESEAQQEIEAFFDRCCDAIKVGDSTWGLVGIHRRGDVLAERLRQRIIRSGGEVSELGVIDITLYRDDFSPDRPQPTVRPSRIPFDIDGANILLVDDVFQSGRTIRAALTQLADFGRPRRVVLAVFIDRMQRELPICPDVVGLEIDRAWNQHVQLRLREVDGCDQITVVTEREPDPEEN